MPRKHVSMVVKSFVVRACMCVYVRVLCVNARVCACIVSVLCVRVLAPFFSSFGFVLFGELFFQNYF